LYFLGMDIDAFYGTTSDPDQSGIHIRGEEEEAVREEEERTSTGTCTTCACLWSQ
jgi:hypothetical protein